MIRANSVFTSSELSSSLELRTVQSQTETLFINRKDFFAIANLCKVMLYSQMKTFYCIYRYLWITVTIFAYL